MTGHKLSVGVIGAGRVGAVLAAALQRSEHPIVAVAGESAASRLRVETLLPGVTVMKPTAVARAAELLLLTVPDDALDNVVRMLVASKAIRPGQYVVHTSGRHGMAVLQPALDIGAFGIAMHPALTFTGTDLDLPRLAGCSFGVTCMPQEQAVVRSLVDDVGGLIFWVDESNRTLYHAALAHGANHLGTLVAQAMRLLREAGSTDPAVTLGPLLRAALDNALDYGDAALTGPVVRGDVETVRAHLHILSERSSPALASYVVMARATAERAVADGRLEPRRAVAITEVLDAALGSLLP